MCKGLQNSRGGRGERMFAWDVITAVFGHIFAIPDMCVCVCLQVETHVGEKQIGVCATVAQS